MKLYETYVIIKLIKCTYKKKDSNMDINEKKNSVDFGNNNSCIGDFAFVLKIEDKDNELKILFSGACEGEKGSDIDTELNDTIIESLADSFPVYPNPNEIYEITFTAYITYQVRNESYSSYDENEIRSGKWLILFEKSKFLDYFQNVTDCCQFEDNSFYPGEWKHYGVYSENHIIDIISHKKPIIKKL